VLIGFSFGLRRHWKRSSNSIDATTVRNPFQEPAFAVQTALSSCFQGLTDTCVGQKEQGPCFQSVAHV
jgi:hypothetical protein